MLIVCPNCATSYDVEVASLPPDGRRVRCVRCRTVWHAELPRKDKLIAAAEALAPARPMADAASDVAAGAGEPAASAAPGANRADLEAELLPASAGPAAERPASEAIDPPLAPTDMDGAGQSTAADDVPVAFESPPTVPAESDGGFPSSEIEAEPPVSDDEPLEDIESVAARRFPLRGRRNRWQWPLSRLQSAMLALIVLDATVIGWRGDFVRAMPQTASFYAWLGLPVNVRGLDFDGLATATEEHDGVPILVVRGNIVNITGKTENVPHLRFAVRNAARQEIYSWSATPPQSAVTAGQAIAFQTRLASPPPDSHDVLVRFVSRYDILAGTH